MLYHVQYFGDAPESGYIFERNMVSFRGEHQYQDLSQRNKLQQQQQPSRTLHKNVRASTELSLYWAQHSSTAIPQSLSMHLFKKKRFCNFAGKSVLKLLSLQ